MFRNINALFDWFIPEEVMENLSKYGKAKMIVGIGLLLGFIVLLQSLRSFFSGAVGTGFIIVAFSLFVMSGPFLLKWTKSTNLSGNLTILGLFLLAFLIVLMRGGINSSIASYLSMVPLVGLMVAGLRSGIIWGVISVIALVMVYSLKRSGVALPPHDISPEGLETYLLITYGSLVVFATILGGIFETVSSGNFNRFRDAKSRSDAINQDMRTALDDVDAVMKSISENNLAKKVSYDIEGELNQLKISVNSTIDLLNQTILNVTDSSEEIFSRAETLAASSKSIADGSATQASNVRDISSAMNEIGEVAKQNNLAADQSKQISRETIEFVNQGNQQMNDMVATMNRIDESGQNINKVVKVISDIASQTNLLALNAAVEAARAGSAGKGFSVVAEEVRSLAKRSADAVKETTDLIEESNQEIQAGVSSVNSTAEMLGKIMERIERINNLINEIADGSTNQKTGIEDITRGLEQVNDVVRQNAAISEKTAVDTDELREESTRLQTTMRQFILDT